MAIDINIYRFMNAYGKLVDKYTSPMDPSRLRIPTFHDFSWFILCWEASWMPSRQIKGQQKDLILP